jgi:CPA2 family monovalent cation:H+ antiporter-2
MCLLYSEVTTRGHPQARRLRPAIESVLKFGAAAGLGLWLVAILPTEGPVRWLWGAGALVAVIAVVVLRRKLIYWHSELEVEILSAIEPDERKLSSSSAVWLQSHGDWNLNVIDFTLPDLADCQGRTIAELGLRKRLGCSIVGIERQGYMIPLPTPDVALFPRDKVLLMGTDEQVSAGRAFLSGVTGVVVPDSVFAEVRMEVVVLPAGCRAVAGKSEAIFSRRKSKTHASWRRIHRSSMRSPSGPQPTS